jgi:hypothetical protein
LRRTGPRTAIEPQALGELVPVPFGGRDWLGPREYADGYAERGWASQSVSFSEAMVERQSLLNWLTSISTRKHRGLSEGDVRNLIQNVKEQNSSVSIGRIENMVKSKDPLFPRDEIRKIARAEGVEGQRGRPKKSAK